MATFKLVTEGITDQIVLEYILTGYFKNEFDVDVDPLLPLRDETDKNRQEENTKSGWAQVIEYCKSSDFQDALVYLQDEDYIIVCIDTDVSEKYDIPKHDENGQVIATEQLIQNVIHKFTKLIDNFEAHQEKIIFAIAVHSIECWLLPLFHEDDDQKAGEINDCFEKLREETRNIHGYSLKKKANIYRRVVRQYKHHDTLMNLYPKNPSLKYFINSLPQ